MAGSAERVYRFHIRDCSGRLNERGRHRGDETIPVHILFDAACRNLEILGEASRKISPEFRERHPTIPWREMNDLRNVLIHNYDGINPHLVWSIIEREIPKVLEAVASTAEWRMARGERRAAATADDK